MVKPAVQRVCLCVVGMRRRRSSDSLMDDHGSGQTTDCRLWNAVCSTLRRRPQSVAVNETPPPPPHRLPCLLLTGTSCSALSAYVEIKCTFCRQAQWSWPGPTTHPSIQSAHTVSQHMLSQSRQALRLCFCFVLGFFASLNFDWQTSQISQCS